ncbi:MAG: YraN family protein [Gemmatimonadales bacterium]|nr:YraN family protein [Gemmatimonadales bacterium]
MSVPNIVRPLTEWRDPRHRRGLAGELAAARDLEARGWTVLAHRFRFGHSDLDLVARQGNLVAFLEVKTRQSDAFGGGLNAVGWRKRQSIAVGAMIWISRFGQSQDSYRFDLVVVELSRGGFPQIIHIEDAWRHVEK